MLSGTPASLSHTMFPLILPPSGDSCCGNGCRGNLPHARKRQLGELMTEPLWSETLPLSTAPLLLPSFAR